MAGASPLPEGSTVHALLDHTTRALAEASRSPRLDAEMLLAEVLGRSRTWLLTWSDQSVGEAEATRLAELVERRRRREPVAYILGRRSFYDLDLAVTRDVLIPRPETETLVEEALRWLDSRPGARVLDVGTGSGAIAIALARHAPRASVTATDLSVAALTVARSNAHRNGVNGITWYHGSVYEAVREERFDLVVSNPPYISPQEYERLEPNVREYEPVSALRADENGLAILRRLCEGARTVLRPNGALGVEIGATQGAAVRRLMQDNGFDEVRVVPDLAGHDRIVWGQVWTDSSSRN